MQQDDKTVLCESENGSVSAFNNAVAYELRYKQIVLILNSEQIHKLKYDLQELKAWDWITASDTKITFFTFPQLSGSYLVNEQEVTEMLSLLLEAAAMIKVHLKLMLRITDRIN